MLWYYYGCGHAAGHYLFSGQGEQPKSRHAAYLSRYDGKLAPLWQPPYVAACSRLGHIGYSAISWYDQSVDKRPGSNSIVFVNNLVIDQQVMLEEAHAVFPWVFDRLPEPVRFIDVETIRT